MEFDWERVAAVREPSLPLVSVKPWISASRRFVAKAAIPGAPEG
jgi:hypothetical protein